MSFDGLKVADKCGEYVADKDEDEDADEPTDDSDDKVENCGAEGKYTSNHAAKPWIVVFMQLLKANVFDHFKSSSVVTVRQSTAFIQ